MRHAERFGLFGVAGLLALAGCSEPDTPRTSYGRLLIQLPDQGALTGIADGTIDIDDAGCAFLLVGIPAEPVALVWPSGTTFDDSARTIDLRDGTVVRDGDLVELGGGHVEFEPVRYMVEPSSITANSLACLERSTSPKDVWFIAETQGTVSTAPGVKVLPPED